ncbi:hypothetical protein DFH06DRAFT_1477397 [Mycena polygramma]|nr:hypothetical protein DFH06DRAFT_1477397 [Mycena polygramma]
MRSLYTTSKSLGRICARERRSSSCKVIVRDWHRIGRVGREDERLEREEFPLVRPSPKSVTHFNPHGTLLGRRIEYFRAAGSVPASAPCGTPHTGSPILSSRPSHFTATHNVRGFRSSAVSALEEAAPAAPRARGRPRRSAPPDSPDDAPAAAQHDAAPRRPRGRPRRDVLPSAPPASSDDALTGAKHDGAPRRPRGRPRRDAPPPGSPSKHGAASVLPAVPAPQSKFADPIGLWDVDQSDPDSDSDGDPGCEFYFASDSEDDVNSDAESEYESNSDAESESEHESDSDSESGSESESDSDDEPDSDYAPDRSPRWEEALVANIDAWRDGKYQ